MGTPPLRQGTIVKAEIEPEHGQTKNRPAVVLTPTHLIAGSTKVALIGISTSYYPGNDNHILIPWHPDGRGPTRLRRPCAMCIDLVDTEIDKAAVKPSSASSQLGMAELLLVLKQRGIRF